MTYGISHSASPAASTSTSTTPQPRMTYIENSRTSMAAATSPASMHPRYHLTRNRSSSFSATATPSVSFRFLVAQRRKCERAFRFIKMRGDQSTVISDTRKDRVN